MKREIKIGERFGRLTVIKYSGTVKYFRRVLSICDCGKEVDVRFCSLLSGTTKSCGCLRNERHLNSVKKHGLAKTRVYKIHQKMKQRCYNKKTEVYNYYGERGITICDEWLGENGFINFYNWAMENGYSDDLTIDRIDNDKGYSPDNCRWATREIQSINQRIRKTNTSGFTGVYFDRQRLHWVSEIIFNYKTAYIGSFNTKEKAVKARNDYIIANKLPHKIQEVTV